MEPSSWKEGTTMALIGFQIDTQLVSFFCRFCRIEENMSAFYKTRSASYYK